MNFAAFSVQKLTVDGTISSTGFRFVNSLYRKAIDCSILNVDHDDFPRVLYA